MSMWKSAVLFQAPNIPGFISMTYTANPGGRSVYSVVCGRSLAGNAGSNPTRDMHICLL